MKFFNTVMIVAAAAVLAPAQAQDAADINQAVTAAEQWLAMADKEQ